MKRKRSVLYEGTSFSFFCSVRLRRIQIHMNAYYVHVSQTGGGGTCITIHRFIAFANFFYKSFFSFVIFVSSECVVVGEFWWWCVW